MSIRKQIHQIIREEYTKVLEEEKIKEGLASWIGGVARNIAYSVIDKRSGYLNQAIKTDPKLIKLAKDLKLSTSDFEKRVATLLDKDPDFLKALATQRARSSTRL